MTLFGRGAGGIYLHDGKSKCKVAAREGVLVKDILRQVVPTIPPAARVFFGLCDLKTGYCMSHYQTLSAADCKHQYQVRVFVNSRENGFQFQKMPGKAAYDYYYSQLREDFVHGRLYPPVSVNTAVWMAAIDIAREATEKKKKFEDIIRSDRDMLRFMPMELRDRWKSDQDVQRQLKATFEKFHCVDAGADHFKGKYIEVYEKDGMCGRHIFKLKQSMAKKEQLLLLMVSSQDGISKMQRNGAQKNETEDAETLCTFDEIEALSVDVATLTVSIATGATTEDKTPPIMLRFTNKPEMVAFAVVVHTYYQLLVDANAIILQGDLRPPEECFLVGPEDGRKADLCHAPLSHSSVHHVLERFQLEEGHFMVRESRNEDDAYTLSLCHDQKIKNFRIVRSREDGMLSLKDPEGSEEGSSHEDGEEQSAFRTIQDLIEHHCHRKNGLPTYLKTNYCPKVTGRIPMYPTAHRSSSGTLSTSSGVDESQGSPAPENRIIQALKEADIRWIDFSTVEIVKHIGSGHFSNVFEAVWNSPDNGKVRAAVKVPNVMQSSNVEAVMNDLKREIETMAQLKHENVVNLLGVTAASHFLSFVGEFPMVIMEFIEGGCLRGYLERIKRGGLNATKMVMDQKPVLLQFSMQIAEGMQYLEEAKVVHRDLATRNVLVVNERQVKISDFGLARLRFENKDYYQGKDKKDLPIYWYAPECLLSLKFTHKSDVWSYGATLWEIFTFGELPTTILQKHIAGKTISEAFQALARFFQQGHRLPQRSLCPPEVYDIMKECWDIDPARRPTFSDLTTKIALVKTSIM